jgi:hypothetical protein
MRRANACRPCIEEEWNRYFIALKMTCAPYAATSTRMRFSAFFRGSTLLLLFDEPINFDVLFAEKDAIQPCFILSLFIFDDSI